jgi:UDP-arabinose 4-epimerase
MSWIALRYFNAAGADPDGEIGEGHTPETHLIPRAVAAAFGDLPELEVFGTDHNTPDGTAIRDYVHVTDLAAAHVAALKRMTTKQCAAVNIGTGRGHSVRSVIHAVEQVTGRRIPVVVRPRRTGDPSTLVADGSHGPAFVDWEPKHSSLTEIVQTAVRWHASARAKARQHDSGPLAG